MVELRPLQGRVRSSVRGRGKRLASSVIAVAPIVDLAGYNRRVPPVESGAREPSFSTAKAGVVSRSSQLRGPASGCSAWNESSSCHISIASKPCAGQELGRETPLGARSREELKQLQSVRRGESSGQSVRYLTFICAPVIALSTSLEPTSPPVAVQIAPSPSPSSPSSRPLHDSLRNATEFTVRCSADPSSISAASTAFLRDPQHTTAPSFRLELPAAGPGAGSLRCARREQEC